MNRLLREMGIRPGTLSKLFCLLSEKGFTFKDPFQKGLDVYKNKQEVKKVVSLVEMVREQVYFSSILFSGEN